MKYLFAACAIALSGVPVDAFERMTRSECRLAIERFSEMMSDSSSKTQNLSNATEVSPRGWCEVRSDLDGFENAEFDRFEWRAEEITRWTRDGIPPMALELRITGLDPDEMQDGADTGRPPVDMSVSLRQIPEAGQVIVERAVMENSAGDVLSVSGVFERLFLSSPSMMQVSVGAATFKAGLLSLTLEGTHENPFGFRLSVDMQGVPQAQRDAAFEMISNLPDGLISDESRAELTAFAGDLPKPVGTLEVAVNSERGLGIMQVGVAVAMSWLAILTEEEDANQLEVMLDGLTVDADWSPDAQVAD